MLTIPTTYVKNDFDQLYFKTMISMMELLQRENLRRPVTSRFQRAFGRIGKQSENYTKSDAIGKVCLTVRDGSAGRGD